MNIFLEQTYNTYIPPKNTSLSMNFQSNTNKNFNKKYIPDTNLQIQYINPKQNKKDNKIINIDYIEPPFFPDFNFKLNLDDNSSKDDEDENKDDEPEQKMENYINDINENKNEENKNNENDDFVNLIGEEDELLFYDEKLKPGEDPKKLNEWNSLIKNNDVVSDFQYLKQKIK